MFETARHNLVIITDQSEEIKSTNRFIHDGNEFILLLQNKIPIIIMVEPSLHVIKNGKVYCFLCGGDRSIGKTGYSYALQTFLKDVKK